MKKQEAVKSDESLPDNFYGKNYGRIPTGKDALPTVTYEQMLEADPGPTPPAVNYPGNHDPKLRHISYKRYWDPEIAALEDEHLWKKRWLCAGRTEDIPEVGDRMAFNIRDKSYLIVRSSPNEIKAFYNTCRHRGRTLCDSPESGKEIRCPYHAWTYKLDGSLAWRPLEHEFASTKTTPVNLGLIEVRCDIWGGNIFINADPKAPELEKELGVLVHLFEDWNRVDRYTVSHLRKKVRVNWKVAQEAFQEAYHVIETHWDSLAIFGDTTTTYDCWQDEYSHIGRLITPTGLASGFMADKVTTRESVEQYVKLYNNKEAAPGRGETVADARNYLAELKREQLEAARGIKIEGASNPMLLDFVKYFMFPNFHPWWGEQFPITYRFLPIGMNPEECLIEIRMLAPLPKEGPMPVSAKPVDVDFDQPCSDFPELGFMGYIADQDASNMVPLQRGMRAAPDNRASPILASYQERQIAHFHETYDRLLGLDKKLPPSVGAGQEVVPRSRPVGKRTPSSKQT